MWRHPSCFVLYLIQSVQNEHTVFNREILTFHSLRGGFILLDYIWLDDKSPILGQLPSNFIIS